MNTVSQTEEKNTRRYCVIDRAKQSAILDDAKKTRMSQRQLAEKYNIPKSTLQHWMARTARLKEKTDPNAVAFFESSSGQAWLHQLILGAMTIFHGTGSVGIPMLSRFFEMTEINLFVGTSVSALQKISKNIDDQILLFEKEEVPRLAQNMPHKNISCGLDENFIMNNMTLILMDAVSGYILAEELEEKRDAETWHKVTIAATKGLKVMIQHLVGDEASGLRKLAKESLQVIKSSDLFHIQQDITKGLTSNLSRILQQSKAALEDLKKEKEKVWLQVSEKLQEAGSIEDLPKRGINAVQRMLEIDKEEKAYQKKIETTQIQYENAQDARHAITNDYHPFSLETGEKQTPEDVKIKLEQSYSTLEAISKEIKSTEKQEKKLQKAKGLIGSMIATLAFFFSILAATIKTLGLDNETAKLFEKIVGMEYLKLCLKRAKNKNIKEKIRATLEKLEGEIESNPTWIGISPAVKTVWKRKALDCAQVFQRSSSCVEGRNGQLSLKFHAFRRVDAKKLKVLTILHNFFIKRVDNTTAAERFFEQKQKDLFKWILSKVELQARPRSKHVRRTKSNQKQAA